MVSVIAAPKARKIVGGTRARQSAGNQGREGRRWRCLGGWKCRRGADGFGAECCCFTPGFYDGRCYTGSPAGSEPGHDGRHGLNGERRIGVFGGTFDPIHVGHLIVAEIMRHRLRLSRVFFLPAGIPPHKPGRIVSDTVHRLAMLRLSIDDSPDFEISTIDLEREGWSYTADSLGILRDRVGGKAELFFLMGQDSLRDFPTWNRPGRIAEQARLGVALRPGVEVDVAEIERVVPETRNRIDLVSIPLIGVSSTEIRANVRAGGPYRYQVLPEVADYIEANDLYRASDLHEGHTG